MEHNTKMTIEDMLRDGSSVDSILDLVKKEIANAQAALKAEEEAKKKAELEAKKREARVVGTRKRFIHAMVEYLVELGVLAPEEVSPSMIQMFEEVMKDYEPRMQALAAMIPKEMPLIGMVKLPNPAVVQESKEEELDTQTIKDESLDAWLHDFVRSLK